MVLLERDRATLRDVVLLWKDRAMPSDGGVFLQTDRRSINGQGRPRRVMIMTTACRLLCDYLASGEELFGDDLASYRNSSISCSIIRVEGEHRLLQTSLLLRNVVYILLVISSFADLFYWLFMCAKTEYVIE